MSVIYLDHAATAYPRHPSVAEAMVAALQVAGNVGRGGHAGAAKGTSIVERCREKLAELLGTRRADRMLLFPSATTALNTALEAFASQSDQKRLLIGPLEHNAVTRPAWRRFGPERVSTLPALPTGVVDVERLDELKSDDVAAVVVQHASNVCGVVQPIEAIGTWCAERGLPFVVDGAQAAGLVPFRIDEIPSLRAYTTAGHKFLGGPPGVGVAYFAPRFDPTPLWVGGNGVRSQDSCVPEEGPARYECGTANLPGIAGLEAALTALLEVDRTAVWERSASLRARWVERLSAIDAVTVVGEFEPCDRTPIIPIQVRGYSPAEASAALESAAGIRTRAGLHCAPAAHQYLGTLDTGTLRLAPGLELTRGDEETVFESLRTLLRG